jgi:heme-degrading monooxygenase HmoA
MVIQIVRYASGLTYDEVAQRFEDRSSRYKEVPGLLQKYYVHYEQADQYGGIYVWDSPESLAAWRKGNLAGTLAETYEIVGEPDSELADVMLVLHPTRVAA